MINAGLIFLISTNAESNILETTKYNSTWGYEDIKTKKTKKYRKNVKQKRNFYLLKHYPSYTLKLKI